MVCFINFLVNLALVPSLFISTKTVILTLNSELAAIVMKFLFFLISLVIF